MTKEHITFNEATIKHLTQKIVDVIPGSISELNNNDNFVTEDYVRDKIKTTDKLRKLKGLIIDDGKSIIDDENVSNLKTWSSGKIDRYILENDKDTEWVDIEKSFNPSVEHTIDGHMKEVEIFGNTWQNSDSKNIMPLGYTEESVWNKNENNLYYIEFKVSPDTEYTISYNGFTQSPQSTVLVYISPNSVSYSDASITVIASTNWSDETLEVKGENKTFRTGHSGVMSLWYQKAYDYVPWEFSKINKFQIEKERVPTEYAPPNDLSDIRHVGELQEDGRYKIEVESCNRNLFNGVLEEGKALVYATGKITNQINSWACEKYFYINDKTQRVYVEYKDDTNQSNDLRVCFYNKDKAFISATQVREDRKINYLKPKECKYIRVSTTYGSASSSKGVRLYIGEDNENFIENQSSKQTLLLPCQLSKVGDVQDRLYWNGEKYVIEKNIGKIVLSGSEKWAGWNKGEEVPCKGFYYTNMDLFKSGASEGVISDKLKQETLPDISGGIKQGIDVCWGYVAIGIKKEEVIEGIEQYLSKNNITVYYPAKTSQLIETEITKQAFPSTFKDKTYFFVKSGLDGEIKGKVPMNKDTALSNLISSSKNLQQNIYEQQLLEERQDKKINEIESAISVAYSLVQQTEVIPELEVENNGRE